jgi:hypothetical protein
MSMQQGYASFLIRMWREVESAAPDAVVDWHGEIEHIQSGQRWQFTNLSDLIAFLRAEAPVSPERRNTR